MAYFFILKGGRVGIKAGYSAAGGEFGSFRQLGVLRNFGHATRIDEREVFRLGVENHI